MPRAARAQRESAVLRLELVQCKSLVSNLTKELEEKTSELKEKSKSLEEAQRNHYHHPGRSATFMSPQKQIRNKCSQNGAMPSENDITPLIQEINILRQENRTLRNDCLQLQSNLFGAQLANKYLDKELAGRIQQIQLLAKSDLRGIEHDRLWNQLEAEIHLHRHKTVVKACRGRITSSFVQSHIPAGNRTKRIINTTTAHRYTSAGQSSNDSTWQVLYALHR